MTVRLTAPLRQAPATVPAFAALVLFVVWSSDQAGYPVTHWAPGGLIVLLLLGIAGALVRLRIAEVPLAVRIAIVAMTAYTALSFLSILWAEVPGEAWEGANRTLLYLLVLILFAGWRGRGVSSALLLCSWSLAIVALAAFAALHIDAAHTTALQTLLPGGRLDYPSGYPNANAAQWLMAFWPAVLLARSERLPSAVRGLLAGGAVLLAEIALLSQSRGSLYATPVMIVLVFALLPERRRTFAVLLAVVPGIALAAPAVLRVGDHLHNGLVSSANVHSAVRASFIAAAAVAILVAILAALESRSRLSDGARRRVGLGMGALATATLLAVIAGALIAAGNPLTRVEHGWQTFKAGYASGQASSNRLTSGLGSNRYDFYRVALNEFMAHPLVGIGADNFQQQYLAHGRSSETPHYPHSVEFRTLAQSGIIGALLALIGLAAALLAARRALASADPLARTVAAASLAGFAYWVVHGSFDWFWEFAGLGAPAFAMLGIACALAPRRAAPGDEEAATRSDLAGGGARGDRPGAAASEPGANGSGRARARRRGLIAATAAAAAIAITASFAAPWLSQLQVQSAARIWTKQPLRAYARLDDAADLDPLSDQPYLVAGSIALRYGDIARADHDFALALKRSPDDAYATLERGAIASARGERPVAIKLLERAQVLNPRDEVTREALAHTRRGVRINIEELNRSILLKAQQL